MTPYTEGTVKVKVPVETEENGYPDANHDKYDIQALFHCFKNVWCYFYNVLHIQSGCFIHRLNI